MASSSSSSSDWIKQRQKEVVDKYLKREPSFCRVYDDVWIGDLNAAIKIAKTGAINGTKFGGVLNAAGTESFGLTLEHDYIKKGILYETLLDNDTGMTLQDGNLFIIDDEEILASMIISDDIKPSIVVEVHEQKINVHKEHYINQDFFRYCMVRAARIIDKMITTTNKVSSNVFVHCMAGKNRSAAAIAAYLMFIKRHFDAIRIVQECVKSGRNVDSLTNKSFIVTLESMYAFINPENIESYEKQFKEKHIQRYKTIVQKAIAAQQEPELSSSSTGSINTVITPTKSANKSLYDDDDISLNIGCDSRIGQCCGGGQQERDILEKKFCDMLIILPYITDKCCSTCGASTCKLLRCSICKKVYYCSVNCQKKDTHHQCNFFH